MRSSRVPPGGSRSRSPGRSLRLCAGLTVALFLSACALDRGSDLAWADGWRAGRIVELAREPATPNRWASGCASDSRVRRAALAHAIVEFRLAGRLARIDAPVLETNEWQVGQMVQVNVLDCDVALVAT